MKKPTKFFIIILIIIVGLMSIFCACKNKCVSGHTWELISTTTTCYDGGVETYKCKKCKTTKSEEVEAYGHDYVLSSRTEPTCKTNGEEVKNCLRCGFESKQTLLMIDHDYQVKSTTPSTCTVKGSQTLECSMCHEIKNETLPLVDHSYELVQTIPSTCAIKGSMDYECTACHDTYSNELPLEEHNYELVNTTLSTCVEHGSKDFECSVCHNTYSEELPLADHKYETQTVESTCFTHGGTVEKCSVCQDQKPVNETPLLTHSFGADGYCEHCGIYETLFDVDELNVTWSANATLGTVRGNLVAKFKENGTVPNSYWQDHTVEIKITLLNENDETIKDASFASSTLESGELIISHINYVQANKFSLFFGEYDIFTAEELKACTSFKIELSCDGYKTIEKTYQI